MGGFFKLLSKVTIKKVWLNSKALIMSKRKTESVANNKSKKSCTTAGNKHWAMGLLDSMNDPELQVHSDDLVIVIKDKFPKAKFHYLILPKDNISNLKRLTTEHLELLQHMETVAKDLIKKDMHKESKFKCGYHAEASMFRLHMHVISDDMVSPCLKTKKHWNSFTTEFFLKPEFIQESLQKHGTVKLPSAKQCKEYMETPLACHKCSVKPKNIPTLKEHILSHTT